MTARLAIHPLVADRTEAVLDRFAAAGVDVEHVGRDGSDDPLAQLRDKAIDLALVGIDALRGIAADELTTVAVLPRDEVRDVMVPCSPGVSAMDDLTTGHRVGVAGARRAALLAAHRPTVTAVDLPLGDPGEVNAALNREDIDAIVVSAIAARSAGRSDAATEALEPKSWLPAPGQGALALIARHPIAEATALDHLPTRTALRTELALLDALEPSGDSALGCLAQPSGRWIRLWASVASSDGRGLVRCDLTGPLDEPESLGRQVAETLRARGYALVVGR